MKTKLICETTGKELKSGDTVTTFRGENCTLVDWSAPHRPNSSGRVIVRFADGKEHEFFPGVIGASIATGDVS